MNSEITDAWEAAQEAAKRYGDFVKAIMNGIDREIDTVTTRIDFLASRISELSSSSSSSSSVSSSGASSEATKPTVVGTSEVDTSYTAKDTSVAMRNAAVDIVSKMKTNSTSWHTSKDPSSLASKNEGLADSLKMLGIEAERDPNGVWLIKSDGLNQSNVGKKLYDCYHTGGFVGEKPLKSNEQYIKVENDELVMTSRQQDNFSEQLALISALTEAFTESMANVPVTAKSLWPNGIGTNIGSTSSSVMTNNNRSIVNNFGDTTINCASEQSVDAHQKLNRDFLNQIAREIRKL